MCLRRLLYLLTLLLTLLLAPVLANAQAYEAPLPVDLPTAPDLCARVPCTEVLPGADSFSERMGRPTYVEGYKGTGGERKLVGYVFLSTDIVDIPAYSGKPVVTLIGMSPAGIITGTRILRHSEPILLLGIPESVLTKFVNQYLGKFVGDRIEIGKGRNEEGYIGLDAISGATVTVIAQNQVVMRSGVAIARQVGILKVEPKPPIRFAAVDERLSWDQLVHEGSVRRLTVRPEQLGMPRAPEPYVDMFFGYLNTPAVGKSVLGEAGYSSLMSRLKPNEHAIFIVSNGSDSFKGSGFVRGGIYDRVQVGQDMDAYSFRDLDYLQLWGLQAPGAPDYKESAIFIIRDPGFAAAFPWTLIFLGNKLDRETGQRQFVSFDSEYWVQAKYMDGGRPKVATPEAPWVRIWRMRALEIGLFTSLLVAVGVVYALRERLTRLSTHKNKWPVNGFKYAAWALSIGFIGFGLMAQPSITQVLTWFHALLFQWTWSLFLSDPFIFVFWIFIIVTVFLFGRGLFCGWLCPFGSLSEAIYKLGGAIGLKRWQRHLPRAWHDRLKWVKYGIFFGLLAVSMFSMVLAEVLAEVEPFKTTFLVGVANRAWPYGLFVVLILGVSLFVERPYCKYICPLGAALAMPSTFRWFGLRRKTDCNSCKACAVGCGSLAIDADGRIDHRECLHCLDCMVLYTDQKGCPPLARERKRRERDGLLITPIGRDGYFIPIDAVPAVSPRAADGPDPRMASAPAAPAHLARPRSLAWLLAELRDHLFPWTREGWHSRRAWQVAGVSLAIAATLAWAWAAAGRLSTGAIVAWWFGWSLYEVLMRLQGRRYVKEGPWWHNQYRVATLMDMLSYVGFKNLLIGAALFLALKAIGMLHP